MVAAILVSTATVGGFVLLGTDLPSSVGADPSGLFDVRAGSDYTAADELNRSAVERLMFNRINSLRAERNATVWVFHPALAEIAESHSEDMAARSYTAHVSPDGETVVDRFAAAGYECDAPGELLLLTQYGTDIETQNGTVSFRNETELADGIVGLWMQSDPHRQALLTEPWDAVGIGVVVTDEKRVYVTLNGC